MNVSPRKQGPHPEARRDSEWVVALRFAHPGRARPRLTLGHGRSVCSEISSKPRQTRPARDLGIPFAGRPAFCQSPSNLGDRQRVHDSWLLQVSSGHDLQPQARRIAQHTQVSHGNTAIRSRFVMARRRKIVPGRLEEQFSAEGALNRPREKNEIPAGRPRVRGQCRARIHRVPLFGQRKPKSLLDRLDLPR